MCPLQGYDSDPIGTVMSLGCFYVNTLLLLLFSVCLSIFRLFQLLKRSLKLISYIILKGIATDNMTSCMPGFGKPFSDLHLLEGGGTSNTWGPFTGTPYKGSVNRSR